MPCPTSSSSSPSSPLHSLLLYAVPSLHPPYCPAVPSPRLASTRSLIRPCGPAPLTSRCAHPQRRRHPPTWPSRGRPLRCHILLTLTAPSCHAPDCSNEGWEVQTRPRPTALLHCTARCSGSQQRVPDNSRAADQLLTCAKPRPKRAAAECSLLRGAPACRALVGRRRMARPAAWMAATTLALALLCTLAPLAAAQAPAPAAAPAAAAATLTAAQTDGA